MTLRIIETYSVGEYQEVEVFECTRCGRRQSHYAGADPCGCICEYENEGEGDER